VRAVTSCKRDDVCINRSDHPSLIRMARDPAGDIPRNKAHGRI